MRRFLTAFLLLGATPAVLQACSTCFGDPNSPMTKGMNVGILVLLFIVGGVLGAIGAFFFYLFKRSKSFIVNGPEELGIRRMNQVRAFHE
jgi:hypothetical protein